MADTTTFFFLNPFFFLPFKAYFIICSVSSASIFVSSVVSSLVSSPISTPTTGVGSVGVSYSAEKLITYPSAPFTLISMSGSAAALGCLNLISFFFFFTGASGYSDIIYSNGIPSFLHRSRSCWYFLNPLMTVEVFELWARNIFK